MGVRSSMHASASGSKDKLILAYRSIEDGATDKMQRKSDPMRPAGGQMSYVDRGRIAKYDAGVSVTGRRSKPHGYLSGGGTRIIRTGSSDVVTPISGRPLF